MDVLTIIKSDHNSIREMLSGFKGAVGVKPRRGAYEKFAKAMQTNLILERDYLYPELQGLFGGAETLVDQATERSKAVEKKLKAIGRVVAKPVAQQVNITKKINELEDSITEYLTEVEEMMMPKVRAHIRTEEREDLAEVFADVKEQLAVDSLKNVKSTTSGNQRKKRA